MAVAGTELSGILDTKQMNRDGSVSEFIVVGERSYLSVAVSSRSLLLVPYR